MRRGVWSRTSSSKTTKASRRSSATEPEISYRREMGECSRLHRLFRRGVLLVAKTPKTNKCPKRDSCKGSHNSLPRMCCRINLLRIIFWITIFSSKNSNTLSKVATENFNSHRVELIWFLHLIQQTSQIVMITSPVLNTNHNFYKAYTSSKTTPIVASTRRSFRISQGLWRPIVLRKGSSLLLRRL